MQKHAKTERKQKRVNESPDRELASCEIQSAATNRDRQNRGAAVLAPLGAFGLQTRS